MPWGVPTINLFSTQKNGHEKSHVSLAFRQLLLDGFFRTPRDARGHESSDGTNGRNGAFWEQSAAHQTVLGRFDAGARIPNAPLVAEMLAGSPQARPGIFRLCLLLTDPAGFLRLAARARQCRGTAGPQMRRTDAGAPPRLARKSFIASIGSPGTTYAAPAAVFSK